MPHCPILLNQHVMDHAPHEYSIEASDHPATRSGWPRTIETTIGNTLPFVRVSKKVDPEGDVLWVSYRQANGCAILRVYND